METHPLNVAVYADGNVTELDRGVLLTADNTIASGPGSS